MNFRQELNFSFTNYSQQESLDIRTNLYEVFPAVFGMVYFHSV